MGNYINPEQKLNPHLFELGVEQEPIRKGFGRGLLAAAEADERVVGLCADLTESTQMHIFRDKFPERFVEMGVAEQNLAAVASGMAAMGRIPFLSSYAMFSPGRNWEQIRTTICYNNQNVKIVGSHAGVSVGPDGGTHQALEDIAITRVIPRLTVIVPADSLEAARATLAVAKHRGPVYLRLGREKSPVLTTDKSPFKIGEANLLYIPPEPELAIIACGTMVYNALQAAKLLAKEGIAATVTNMHTVKPLDEKTLRVVAREAKAVLTVEEHQRAGGLGGAVAEWLSEHLPKPLARLGADDEFGQSGTPGELIEHYGLSVEAITVAARRLINKR